MSPLTFSLFEGYVNRKAVKVVDPRTDYRGTSRVRISAPPGLDSRTMPKALWRPYGGLLFLVSEVPLSTSTVGHTYAPTTCLGTSMTP